MKLKPYKDYFGWFYNKRTRENKILLHVYTLVFLIVPLLFTIINNEFTNRIFFGGYIFFVLFFFLYPYGFSIHHFPKTREKSLLLVLSSALYIVFVALTGGQGSIEQTLQIDGATIFTAMAIMSSITFFKKYKGTKEMDFGMYIFLLVLLYAIYIILIDTLKILATDTPFLTLLFQALFLGGVVGAVLVHYKYLRDIDSVLHWNSKSKKQTLEIGNIISKDLIGGDILLLYGDLGAGKTTLTKGIAQGLGITKDVTSPTFGLMNVYDVPAPLIKNLVHIDTYRLKDESELVAIGVEEYLGAADCVCIIEWPEKIEGLLTGKKGKKIFLEHHGDEKRKITLDDF